MLQRAWQKQRHGMTGAKRQGMEMGKEWSLYSRSGGSDCFHTRAGWPCLWVPSSSPHYKWAGSTAVLPRSRVREGLRVSGLLHTGFPSAEQGAASPTAAILPCLLQG